MRTIGYFIGSMDFVYDFPEWVCVHVFAFGISILVLLLMPYHKSVLQTIHMDRGLIFQCWKHCHRNDYHIKFNGMNNGDGTVSHRISEHRANWVQWRENTRQHRVARNESNGMLTANLTLCRKHSIFLPSFVLLLNMTIGAVFLFYSSSSAPITYLESTFVFFAYRC